MLVEAPCSSKVMINDYAVALRTDPGPTGRHVLPGSTGLPVDSCGRSGWVSSHRRSHRPRDPWPVQRRHHDEQRRGTSLDHPGAVSDRASLDRLTNLTRGGRGCCERRDRDRASAGGSPRPHAEAAHGCVRRHRVLSLEGESLLINSPRGGEAVPKVAKRPADAGTGRSASVVQVPRGTR